MTEKESECARFETNLKAYYCVNKKQQEGFCTVCATVYPLSEFNEKIVDYACANSVYAPLLCGGKVILREKIEGVGGNAYQGPIDYSVERSRMLRKKTTFQNSHDFHIYCSKCDIQYGHDYDLPINFLDIPCKSVNFKLPPDQRIPCGGKWVAIPRVKKETKIKQ